MGGLFGAEVVVEAEAFSCEALVVVVEAGFDDMRGAAAAVGRAVGPF